MCLSFLRIPLLIASIGVLPAPATKVMGVWKTVGCGPRPISMTRVARDWSGVGQVFRLRRRVEHALKYTQEIVYGITSLTLQRADASRVLELNRAHWSIENRLHYRRDGALALRCVSSSQGGSSHVLAVLNSFVLALLDFCKISNAKQYMRSLDAHPLQAARLLLKSLEEN
jgi:hypothetical protein